MSHHCLAPIYTLQDGLEAYLPLAGMVDAAKEKARLSKQVLRCTVYSQQRAFTQCLLYA
jgi:hypothetical protein